MQGNNIFKDANYKFLSKYHLFWRNKFIGRKLTGW